MVFAAVCVPAYSYFFLPKASLASYPEKSLLRRSPRQLKTVDVPQRMELLPGAPHRGSGQNLSGQ